MSKMLIGLHGKPRVGKDTVAAYLIKKHNLLRYGPSVPVKDATAAMFDIPRHYLDDDNKKDQFDPFWKMTYRQMAQKVGKESSRDVFGDDIWMRHVELKWRGIISPRDELTSHCAYCKHSVNFHTIDAPMDVGGCIKCNCSEYVPGTPYGGMILADVRYANEIEWIKQRGGDVYFVVRDNAPKSSDTGHVVDAGLPLNLADIVIYNNGTIEELYEQIDLMLLGHQLFGNMAMNVDE